MMEGSFKRVLMRGRRSGGLAAALLGSETNGLAFYADDMSLVIRDTTTPANVFSGDANDKLTYASPSTKYIRNQAGIYVPGTTLRCEYDGSGNPLGIRIEEARTNVVLHNRDLTITHQLTVTGGAGSFTDGETVTATGGGTGTYVSAQSTSTLFAIRAGSGTFSGTLTGGTSGATKTISSATAVWTASNITAAKNQTGIDGVTNSASSLTATAGNATCLQAITLASSARYQSAFVKRIGGSGTIQMTMDNGTTWTAVTVTSSWAPVEIPTQTLANPTVGFRIVTSGDAIAIDVVGNENSTSRTSPIITAGSTVTRATDNIGIATNLFNYGTLGTLYAKFTVADTDSTSTAATFAVPVAFGKVADANNVISLIRAGFSGSTNEALGYIKSGGVDQFLGENLGTQARDVAGKYAMAWQTNSARFAFNGSVTAEDTSVTVPTTPDTLTFGYRLDATSLRRTMYLREIMYVKRVFSAAELQTVTT